MARRGDGKPPRRRPGPPETLLAAGGRLRAVPVLHGRFEFALEVRRAFAEHEPTHVAVELPGSLAIPVQEAARRLPALSVLRVQTVASGPGASTGDEPLFVLIEPTDAIIEAVRLGLEQDLPVVCVDADVTGVRPVRQAFPDPHAIEAIGLNAYADPCMAKDRTPARAAQPPADDDRDEVRAWPDEASASGSADSVRERTMAHHLTRILEDPDTRVLFVCGLSHLSPILARVGSEKATPFGRPVRFTASVHQLHPDSSREVLSEMPYLSAAYESWRAGQAAPAAFSAWPLPRHRVHMDLVTDARRRHDTEEGEQIPAASISNLFRYARNCSILEGALAPDFYTLVLAARGVADDNFAYHLWQTGATYPEAVADDGRTPLRVTLEDLQRSGRLVRFSRKIKRTRPVMRLVRQRRTESRDGEWKETWSGLTPCSHPPEDVIIEGYGHFLAKKAKGVLAAHRSRSEPFTSSLLDGIDFRETIRNRVHDGRIYVHHQLPVRGEVGSVVVAFDPDDAEGRYPHRMTWQGEHDQESDMALYSTHPGDQVVGPGVSRCEYGGFLLTWPPGRMFFVWEDPEFAWAATPGEQLLLAAIDYSVERMVVYVAPSPPRSAVRQYAARRDRRLVYLPIGQLSPVTLKKIRVFHVLEGRRVRSYASDYIW